MLNFDDRILSEFRDSFQKMEKLCRFADFLPNFIEICKYTSFRDDASRKSENGESLEKLKIENTHLLR